MSQNFKLNKHIETSKYPNKKEKKQSFDEKIARNSDSNSSSKERRVRSSNSLGQLFRLGGSKPENAIKDKFDIKIVDNRLNSNQKEGAKPFNLLGQVPKGYKLLNLKSKKGKKRK